MFQVRSSCVKVGLQCRGDALHVEPLMLCDVLLTMVIG